MAVDQLQAETDRQLQQQRTHSDALATRAGILIAVCTMLIGLVPKGSGSLSDGPLVLTVGATVVAGIIVLTMCRISPGPSAVALTGWNGEEDSNRKLLDAKLLVIEANSKVLGRTEVVFWGQAVGTAVVAIMIATQA